MSISPLQSAPLAAEIPLERIADNPNLSEEAKVGELSRQFEAVLLRQILTAARKTVIQSEWSDTSTTGGIYQDMVNNQMADIMSRSGDFGLAHSLQAQLTRQTCGPKPAPEPLPSAENTVQPLKASHD